MRWFVDVSPIGQPARPERYCLEADHREEAVTRVRALRGENGDSSVRSGGDDGSFRVVDSERGLEYSATRAPDDSPTTSPPHPVAASRPPPSTTQRSLETVLELDYRVAKERSEEPSAKTPLTYREVAYEVRPGATWPSLKLLLWARFREISELIRERPAGKFVQLAVFDHTFEDRPRRPPLATLTWKDWRGEPVFHFPGVEADASAADVRVVTVGDTKGATGEPPAASKPRETATTRRTDAVEPDSTVAPDTEAAPIELTRTTLQVPAADTGRGNGAPDTEVAATGCMTQRDPAFPPDTEVSIPPSPPSSDAARESEIESTAPDSSSRASVEIADRKTEPAILLPTARRDPRDDLIGELFDAMHDLHFMSDMVSGVQFVLGIVTRMLPCEVALVHVFDINTRTFVVVRAKGPGTHTVVLHRTHDRDSFFQTAMRSSTATRIDDAAGHQRYANGLWDKVDCVPRAVLFGPVNQGGRFLGAIELVNPEAGGSFLEAEAHALDYICEQFADFLANRPLVLEDDVVLGTA